MVVQLTFAIVRAVFHAQVEFLFGLFLTFLIDATGGAVAGFEVKVTMNDTRSCGWASAKDSVDRERGPARGRFLMSLSVRRFCGKWWTEVGRGALSRVAASTVEFASRSSGGDAGLREWR